MHTDRSAPGQRALAGHPSGGVGESLPVEPQPGSGSVQHGVDAEPPSDDVSAGGGSGLPSRLRRENRAEQRGSVQAQRTRALLLAAARRVFEQMGYLDVRVADIVAETGSSHGTFYTYFTSKDDIFRAVMEDALDTVYGVQGGSEPCLSERERIEAANRRFVAVYQQNAAVMGLFEQVATYDLEFRKLRLAVRARWVARIERNMVKLQSQGLCRRDIDPHTAAGALASMASNQVYLWQVMGEEHEEQLLLDTLNLLWIAAIGLVDGA